MNHLLSAKQMDRPWIEKVFQKADKFKRMRAILSEHERILSEETVANLFWEKSTRTRISFEVAARKLGAQVVNLFPSESSVAKGESLKDTLLTLRAIGCRFFVIRHPISGEIPDLAQKMGAQMHIINAGDGIMEHPSQALIDAFTIQDVLGTIEGKKVVILGDISHSRVARSNMTVLPTLGARVVLAGPKEFMLNETLPKGVETEFDVDQAVRDADVVMTLRVQKERMETDFVMDAQTYLRDYGLTQKRFSLAKKNAILMHPGPINRGIEIDSDLADSPSSMILKQAEYGLFIRMAIFDDLKGSDL